MKQIELAYKIARTFEGTHEEAGSKQNKTIVDFHRATTLHASTDETPWCFDGETEVLTEKGFIPFYKLSKEHGKIAQVKQNSLEIEFVEPIKYIKFDYLGMGYELKTRSMSFRCTEKHKFYGTFDKNKKLEFRIIEDFVKSRGIDIPKSKWIKSENVEISDNDLLFIAAFISDGFYKFSKNNKEIPNTINFQVSKQHKIDILQKLNPSLVYKSKTIYGLSKNPLTTLEFKFNPLFLKIFEDYKVLSKDFIFSLSEKQCLHFLNCYKMFDGNGNLEKSYNILYTSNIRILDNLSLISVLANCNSTVSTCKSPLSGKLCYNFRYNMKSETRHLKTSQFKKIEMNETVYCLEVPSNVFVARTKNKVPFITGNCSSFMNFCQLQACFILNSGLMARIMSHKLMAKDIPIMQKYAIDLCDKLGFENQAIFLKNTDLSKNANQKSNGVEIVEPTYSALAASWKDWGISTDEPQIGDLVVFKRRPDGSGSGHISFFNGFSGNINRVVYCYGGNQSNACIDSTYELDRVVTFRTLK